MFLRLFALCSDCHLKGSAGVDAKARATASLKRTVPEIPKKKNRQAGIAVHEIVTKTY